MSRAKIIEGSKLLIKCQSCGIKRYRVAHRIERGRIYYYSLNGKMWQDAKKCNECKNKKAREDKKKDKIKVKEVNKLYGPPEVYHLDKKCKGCNGKMEKSRWLKCTMCMPYLLDQDDDYIYFE